ncbi:MAG TPA: hypothetical protein VLX30_08595 [Burkholderiales bacterium]|nr:hypothetical protein [Burkholderiales bacterium]
MRILLLVVAGLALVGFIVVAVVLPQMESSETKAAAQALIAGAAPAQQQVAAAAEKAGNLSGAGKGIKLAPQSDPKHGELKWVVQDGGEIRGWNEKNAIEIGLAPVLAGGKVSWRCHGYPNVAMPASCGGR